jgi:hypothetical protein
MMHIRHFMLPFEGRLAFDERHLGRVSVIFAGVLNVTEELSVWVDSYCIFCYFYLILLRREKLIFLYSLSSCRWGYSSWPGSQYSYIII